MIKLSLFSPIKNESEINQSDYIVTISVSLIAPELAMMKWKKNIIEYEGKKYHISIMKGMWANFQRTSKTILSEPEFQKRFPDCIIAFGGHIGEGHMDFIAYKTLQAWIDENAVYAFHVKYDIDIDDDAVITAIKNNAMFYSPSLQ